MRNWYMRWRETDEAKWCGFMLPLLAVTVLAMLP